MDVVTAYREVGTLRGAAEICGTTHKTVKRILIRHDLLDCPAAVAERKERGHNYDGMEALVAKRIDDTKGRISAKRLLPAAKAAGYEGSARNFRRLVAAQKALWRRGNHRGRRPAVWTPGEHAGDRLGRGERAARVLRGAGLVAVAVRPLRRRRDRGDDAGAAGRVFRGSRRGAEDRCWPTGWAA